MPRWIERATVVDGTVWTGLYAPDGSFNVVEAPGDEPVGIYHPCGAFWVTISADEHFPVYADDGSYNIALTVWEDGGGA